MARYAKFFSLGGGGGTNNLQLPVGTILDATLRQVQDGTGTGSPLYLSTGGLRVGTTAGSAMYWDDVNNRLGIGTNTPTSILHVKGVGTTSTTTSLLTQSSTGTTTFSVGDDGNILVGASTITFGSNINFNRITSNFGGVTYDNDGVGSVRASYTNGRYSTNDRVGFGAYNNALSRVLIVGTGSTSATTSLLVQNSSGATALNINDATNVLIGTTTDSGYKLDVNGTARVSGPLTVQTSGNNPLRFYSAPGSGSTSPASIEYLYNGGLSGGVRINLTYNTVNINSASGFETVGVAATFGIRTSATGSNYAFAIVSGNGTSPETEFRNGFDYDGNLIFRNNSTIKTISLAYAVGGTLNVQGGQPRSDFPNGSGGNLAINGGLGTGAGTPGSIIFSTSTATTTGTTLQTLSERMRITGTGNVGVGEASPTARLQVKGSGSTSATTSFLVQNSLNNVALTVKDDLGVTFGSGITLNGNITILNGGGPNDVIINGYTSLMRLNASTSIGYFDFFKGGGYSQISSINEPIRYGAPTHLFGGTTNVGSAIVNIESTTQGFLPPRMTTAQKIAITSPANGLIIYDTDLVRPCFFNGATWITL
jgi:hypothetical protein